MTGDPTISDLAEFREWAVAVTAGYGSTVQLLFRGHADKTWELRPTIERVVLDTWEATQYEPTTGQIAKLPELEASVLEDFVRAAPVVATDVSRWPADDDELGWHSVLRHYGGPSPFLDWTRSAYIALYFAARERQAHDGAVIAVEPVGLRSRAARRSTAREAFQETWARRQRKGASLVGSCFAAQPVPWQTPRSLAQQSWVSVTSPPLFDLEAHAMEQSILWFGDEQDASPITGDTIAEKLGSLIGSRPPMARALIAAASKRTILDELASMGLAAHSLFPDLVGVAAGANDTAVLLAHDDARATRRSRDLLRALEATERSAATAISEAGSELTAEDETPES